MLDAIVDRGTGRRRVAGLATAAGAAVREADRERLLLHLLLATAVFAVALPVLVAAVVSTRATGTVTGPADLLPGAHAARNYRVALVDFGFWRYLLNSFVMAAVIVAGRLLLALLAALALVYYRLPYEKPVFLLILFTLLFPVPVRFVPLYELVVAVGWADTMAAITVPYLAGAAAVFVLRQRFLSIPASLVETAKLDGVGPLRFLVSVLVPMSRDVLAGLAVVVFVFAWNQYLWPVVILTTEERQVAQLGLSQLPGGPVTMAGSILTLVPPLVLLVLFRRPLIELGAAGS